ncbi:potassium channel family protein [Oceanithermus profundus]
MARTQRLEVRLALPLALVATVTAVGTLGYWLLWRPYEASWLDALYMTFITITTIGYSEPFPLDEGARIFTMVIGTTGIASLFYVFGVFMDYLVEMGASGERRKRQMERKVTALSEHVILTGLGRVGHQAAEELSQAREPFVVVERDPERVQWAADQGYVVLEGDATEDETLRKAGIERAKGLIAATGDDAANLFIVLSARALNPELYIVARSEDAGVIPKMLKAGANRVIDPYAIGGRRLASLVLHPAVVDFLETTLRRGGAPISIEDILITRDSPLAGRSIAELNLNRRYGIVVLAIIRGDETLVSPAAECVFKPGDQVIVMATVEQLEQFVREMELQEGVNRRERLEREAKGA